MGEKVNGWACTAAALALMVALTVPPVSGVCLFTVWCWTSIANMLA